MSRKSERDFVGGDMSDEEFAALNGDAAVSEEVYQEETVTEAPQEGAPAVAAPEGQTTAETAPQAESEPKMVDVRALQEARAELRRRDEEIARTRAEQVRLDERIKMLNEAITKQNAPKVEEPKIPDPEAEPWEHMQWQLKAAQDRLKEFEERDNQSRQQTQTEREHQAVLDRADWVLAQSRQQEPDVDDAFAFATEAVKGEIHNRLTKAGISGPEYFERFKQMFNNTLTQYAREMPQEPQAAAEHIRRHARFWGWAGPQAQQQAAQPAQNVVQPPAQAQVQQPTIQQRAEQQQRHMSLSGVTGAEPPKVLDAKALANMSDKEYRELLKTASGKKQLEEAFGGF